MSADRTSQLNEDSPLRLSRLPPLAPPRDVLPRILEEVRRRQVVDDHPRWPHWAAAAVLLLFLGVISLLVQRVDHQSQELAGWVEYSQELESQLRQLGGPGRVVRGHRAAALSNLSDQIAMIDWQLARRPAPAGEINLWRQRAVLLNDLVAVHASAEVFAGEQSRRPVVTINRPLGAIPISYEL